MESEYNQVYNLIKSNELTEKVLIDIGWEDTRLYSYYHVNLAIGISLCGYITIQELTLILRKISIQ
jgi:hypothetical protein